MRQTIPAEPTDRAVPGDGVTLHARDWGGPGRGPGAGREDRPALVLLHGLASNARIWDGVARDLAAAGWRAVALDQRGHGASEQPDSGYDFATVSADLDRVIQALELREPLLVGHSWGANVALHRAAHRSGVAAIALVDGAFGAVADSGPSRQAVRERLAPPRFAVPLDDWLGRAGHWLPPGVDPTEGWVREHLRALVEVDGDGLARARFRFDNHMQVIDALYDQRPSELYAKVTCPLLLCPAHGRREAVERVMTLLPDARVTWFEDAMHDIPLQRPHQLAAALAAFATEVAGRG